MLILVFLCRPYTGFSLLNSLQEEEPPEISYRRRGKYASDITSGALAEVTPDIQKRVRAG